MNPTQISLQHIYDSHNLKDFQPVWSMDKNGWYYVTTETGNYVRLTPTGVYKGGGKGLPSGTTPIDQSQVPGKVVRGAFNDPDVKQIVYEISSQLNSLSNPSESSPSSSVPAKTSSETTTTPAPKTSPSLSVNFPTTNLKPGDTGPQVEALQKFLVSQGLMTQAQMNTGAGTYGPQTTAAVTAWQKANGVDNSTGPGYWGPHSITAAQNLFAAGNIAPTGKASGTGTSTSTMGSTGSMQKATLLAVADVASSAAITGKPPLSFADALATAQKDPTIMAKYADMFNLDQESFGQSIKDLQTSINVQSNQQKQQFESERDALSKSQAEAGLAYSGFRGKAEKNLAESESGIITSSRAQIQKNVNDLTASFESKYGTAAVPKASVSFTNPLTTTEVGVSGLKTTPEPGGPDTISGELAGNITGSTAPAKEADINAKALDLYQVAQFPQV